MTSWRARSRQVLVASVFTFWLSSTSLARAAGPLPVPRPLEKPPTELSFVADPISDGAVLSLAVSAAFVSETILTTGEITPQQPQDPSLLLGIDRPVIDMEPVPAWGTVSTIGLFSAIGFAIIDPIATGFRKNSEAAVVDAVIYSETITLTWAMTNLSKIAFRRPRPTTYRAQQEFEDIHGPDATPPESMQTDSALSFYSGHASITSAVAATATYLAFSRSPGTARPWVTLGVGTLTTTLVSVGRVGAGVHFPTDVIAGTMTGIGIGILVPHLHRAEPITRRPIWIGLEPVPGGSSLTFSGLL
jgi:membrane-associated phospholipid phosphatase